MTGPTPYLPEEDSPPREPTPWGFRITLVLVGVYLLYRLGQGMVWAWDALLG
ncbi:MAG TPA: hypothetical protein VIY70_05065 [Acidimicrobiia bacterium]